MRPAQEDIAVGLHQPVAVNDALAVVFKNTLAGIFLQHRFPGFLHLQEEGVAIGIHQKQYAAECAYAADTHHFEGNVPELVVIEQHLVGRCQGGLVIPEAFLQVFLHLRRIGTDHVENGRQFVLYPHTIGPAGGELGKHFFGQGFGLGLFLTEPLFADLANLRVIN